MENRDKVYDIAEFVEKTTFEMLPASTVKAAKALLKDTLATIIAGSTADICPESAKVFLDWGGKEESTVLVHGKKLPAPSAAFVNGLMAHARDFDDTHDKATIHVAVSTIPACLAMSEAIGDVSGKEFITSVVLAVDVFARLALSLKQPITESGWMYSALCGYFGCAAGAAKAARMDADQIANSIGIVYSQASGNHQVTLDAALTKRMQPAFAARGGVLSACLSRAGVKGVRNVFEGRDG